MSGLGFELVGLILTWCLDYQALGYKTMQTCRTETIACTKARKWTDNYYSCLVYPEDLTKQPGAKK